MQGVVSSAARFGWRENGSGFGALEFSEEAFAIHIELSAMSARRRTRRCFIEGRSDRAWYAEERIVSGFMVRCPRFIEVFSGKGLRSAPSGVSGAGMTTQV